MTDKKLLERIAVNPKVMTGKPVIKGTRLTVEFILNLMAHGATIQEIMDEYKGLTKADIQACILFASKALENTVFMPLSVESAQMRFLVDECTGPSVAEQLEAQGHEVFSVYDTARGMDDNVIVQKAFEENWILVTNDKDFGDQIYREHKSHHGVVLLRLDNERAKTKLAC